MYGIAGERRLPEWRSPGCRATRGSAPVRIGNAAAAQFQLDVYGEVMDALYQACKGGLARDDVAWGLQGALLKHLEKVWVKPDEGHLGSARAAAAFHAFQDHGVGRLRSRGEDGGRRSACPVRSSAGASCATASIADVCERGFSTRAPRLRAELRRRGARREPAADRRSPAFFPRTDPRVLSTVEAIRRELTVDGLVQRYLHLRSARRPAGGRGRVPRLQLLAGRQPVPAGSPRRGTRAVRASASAWRTTSACSPRSTTRSRGAFSATFRRRSRT